MNFKRETWLGAGLLLVAVLLLLWAASLLPIDGLAQAFDWKAFWGSTQGFQIDYTSSPPVYNPPWTLALLWPITAFPLPTSRALFAVLTLAILALSLPETELRRRPWLILGLIFAYPTLRLLIDGNLEALVLAGILLMLHSLQSRSTLATAVALILLSTKFQQSWLFALFSVMWMWKHWRKRDLAQAGLLLATYCIPFLLWKGREWLTVLTEVQPTITNISLLALVPERLAPYSWMLVSLTTILYLFRFDRPVSRMQAAGLLAAGLLLSPYTSNFAVMLVLAVGIVPLVLNQRLLGLGLFALYYVPFFLFNSLDARLQWENSYWLITLVLSWAVITWFAVRNGGMGSKQSPLEVQA